MYYKCYYSTVGGGFGWQLCQHLTFKKRAFAGIDKEVVGLLKGHFANQRVEYNGVEMLSRIQLAPLGDIKQSLRLREAQAHIYRHAQYLAARWHAYAVKGAETGASARKDARLPAL